MTSLAVAIFGIICLAGYFGSQALGFSHHAQVNWEVIALGGFCTTVLFFWGKANP